MITRTQDSSKGPSEFLGPWLSIYGHSQYMAPYLYEPCSCRAAPVARRARALDRGGAPVPPVVVFLRGAWLRVPSLLAAAGWTPSVGRAASPVPYHPLVVTSARRTAPTQAVGAASMRAGRRSVLGRGRGSHRRAEMQVSRLRHGAFSRGVESLS